MIEWSGPAGGRSVTGRVAAIIRVVAAYPDRSMTEIARRAQLPVSTAHRLLGELLAARLVQRSPQGRYRIGPAGGPTLGAAGGPVGGVATAPPSAVERCAAVREHVAAGLDDLASVTGLRACFGVWHDGGVAYLGRSGVRGPAVGVGTGVVSAHATALGRALLAYAPQPEVRRILARGLPAYTDRTVTTPAALSAALGTVRARGVAVVCGEWRADESAVAVPVFGPAGVVAALALTGGTVPLAAAADGACLLAVAAPALVVAARALGRRLADDPAALPSGIGPEPLRWPVDPTAPTFSLIDAAGSTA